MSVMRFRLLSLVRFTSAVAIFAITFSQSSFASAGADAIPPAVLAASVVHVRADAGPSLIGLVPTATATGFFVSDNLVLTCNHVTRVDGWRKRADANRFTVALGRGLQANAKLVMRDEESDLALLLVDLPPCGRTVWPALRVGKFTLKPGDDVAVVANFRNDVRLVRGPLLASEHLDRFAVAGAKVREGYSGGPILGPSGDVQGMLSQRDDDDNAMFVRSSVIRDFLQEYQKLSGEEIKALSMSGKPNAKKRRVR